MWSKVGWNAPALVSPIRNRLLISRWSAQKISTSVRPFFASNACTALLRQLRRVAIAAEMSHHHPLDFSRQQLLDHTRGRGVGKMSVPRHDSLFHRPGPELAGLQKFLIVIGLDHEGVHFAQTFDQHLGRVTEIGDEPEPATPGMKRVTDRFDRVMRDRKSLDGDIADGKFRAGPEQAPVAMRCERSASNRFRGKRVAINRHLIFAAEHFEPANMIAMFVREQDAIELFRRDPAKRETIHDLPRAQSAIDQEPAMIGRDQGRISGAAASEHGQTEHVRSLTNERTIHKRKGTRERVISFPGESVLTGPLMVAPKQHWNSFAHLWAQLGSPLRPSAEDQVGYWSFIDPWLKQFERPRILILGVTPELYHLAWPKSHDLIALDRSREMIDEVWPGPPERAHQGDWLEMPFSADSRELALCDGGPILIEYPQAHQRLIEQLHRIVVPGGRVVLRLFAPETGRESVETVLDDLVHDRIANLNILKLRLGMAIQSSAEEGVAVQEILRAVEGLEPDLETLSRRLGWSWDHMRVIEAYRDAPARYYFATEAEITRLFCAQDRFAFLGSWQGSYPLAERCPIVGYERLHSPVETRP